MLEGKSIRSVIESADQPSPHEHLYWLLGRGPNAQWAVRQGDWKLLGNPKDPRQPDSLGKQDQLFLVNLKEDIGETENLAAKHADIAVRLHAIHSQYQAEIEAQ